MEQTSVAYRTLKNISYSFIGLTVPIIFSVFITPVIVHHIGIVDYGVYVLATTITGFLGLLDLGLSAAFVKFLSQYHALQDFEELKNIIKSSNLLYLVVGLLGLLIFLVTGKFFLGVFHVSSISQQHILVVFALAGLAFFVNSANSVYTSVPVALQRYDIYTKLNLAQLTFVSFASLAAVLLGYKLKVIMGINLFAVCANTLAFRYYYKKLMPQTSFAYGWHKESVAKLYGFGIFSAAANAALGSLNQLDRLIIPAFLGPAALTFYSLPGNVAQKTATVVGSLSGVFFPMASSLSAGGETAKLGQIYRKIIRNLTVLAAAITVGISLFGYQILQYWIGGDLGKQLADRGSGVLLILAATYFIMAIFATLYNFLLGIGKQRLLAGWSLGLAVVNLVLLLALIRPFGIVGAAWAYLAGSLPILAFFYYTEKKFFLLQGIGKFYLKLFAKLAIVGVILYAIVNFGLAKLVHNVATLIVVGPVAVLLFLFIYKLFGFFEDEDWQLFKTFGGKIKDRVLGRELATNENIAN